VALLAGGHAGTHQQSGEVNDIDVLPYGPGGLCPVQQHLNLGVELLLDRRIQLRAVQAGASEFVDYVPFFYRERDQVGYESEKRLAGVNGGAQPLRSFDEAFETGNDDRLEQRLLGGEMTVHGANSNPRSASHVVDRHRQALRRENLLGRPEDLR
jgi:hypothetical protein